MYELSLIIRKSHEFNPRFFSEKFPFTRVLGLSNHALLSAKKIIGYHIQRMNFCKSSKKISPYLRGNENAYELSFQLGDFAEATQR